MELTMTARNIVCCLPNTQDGSFCLDVFVWGTFSLHRNDAYVLFDYSHTIISS